MARSNRGLGYKITVAPPHKSYAFSGHILFPRLDPWRRNREYNKEEKGSKFFLHVCCRIMTLKQVKHREGEVLNCNEDYPHVLSPENWIALDFDSFERG